MVKNTGDLGNPVCGACGEKLPPFAPNAGYYGKAEAGEAYVCIECTNPDCEEEVYVGKVDPQIR